MGVAELAPASMLPHSQSSALPSYLPAASVRYRMSTSLPITQRSRAKGCTGHLKVLPLSRELDLGIVATFLVGGEGVERSKGRSATPPTHHWVLLHIPSFGSSSVGCAASRPYGFRQSQSHSGPQRPPQNSRQLEEDGWPFQFCPSAESSALPPLRTHTHTHAHPHSHTALHT